MNQHVGAAGADKRLALQGRHEVISWIRLEALVFFSVSRCAPRRSLLWIRVSKLSLDLSLPLAGGHVWDQSPAALPGQSDSTKHSQEHPKTKPRLLNCLGQMFS